jgi:hypothetical protein
MSIKSRFVILLLLTTTALPAPAQKTGRSACANEDEVVSKIKLPKEGEVKNFSLNSVKKTKTGFEVNVDWGGSLYHYELQFYFRCKGNNLYLYRVRKVSFSTTNSDRGFWDKKETKVITVKPNLPIEKFVMTDYLR